MKPKRPRTWKGYVWSKLAANGRGFEMSVEPRDGQYVPVGVWTKSEAEEMGYDVRVLLTYTEIPQPRRRAKR